ncbi:hypothetical protein CHIBA101_0122 [Actinomyces sp. Chiba101]|nr:hypothetical protein CHIBA101_0122 [Actinomyces sp. Chiba101]
MARCRAGPIAEQEDESRRREGPMGIAVETSLTSGMAAGRRPSCGVVGPVPAGVPARPGARGAPGGSGCRMRLPAPRHSLRRGSQIGHRGRSSVIETQPEYPLPHPSREYHEELLIGAPAPGLSAYRQMPEGPPILSSRPGRPGRFLSSPASWASRVSLAPPPAPG